MFGGNELKGMVLEGEEEEEYWNNFSKKKADKQARIAKNRRGAKVRGRGRGRNGARNGVTRGEKVNIQSITVDAISIVNINLGFGEFVNTVDILY